MLLDAPPLARPIGGGLRKDGLVREPLARKRGELLQVEAIIFCSSALKEVHLRPIGSREQLLNDGTQRSNTSTHPDQDDVPGGVQSSEGQLALGFADPEWDPGVSFCSPGGRVSTGG
jgi:hypothetical protein